LLRFEHQSVNQIDIIRIIHWIDSSEQWNIILNIAGPAHGIVLGLSKTQQFLWSGRADGRPDRGSLAASHVA
jgi:hypothetical protein